MCLGLLNLTLRHKIILHSDITVLSLAYTHNTSPQIGEYISYNHSLLHNKPKQVLHKTLVNISTIWTLVKTYGVAITPYVGCGWWG